MCDHAKQENERIMERPSKSRKGAATGVVATNVALWPRRRPIHIQKPIPIICRNCHAVSGSLKTPLKKN